MLKVVESLTRSLQENKTTQRVSHEFVIFGSQPVHIHWVLRKGIQDYLVGGGREGLKRREVNIIWETIRVSGSFLRACLNIQAITMIAFFVILSCVLLKCSKLS